MKDKRQRIAMAWPYAVYTDPTFAATVLQAAAASAHANGTLPDIAAIANAYQYSAAAAAAAAGPAYFHGTVGHGGAGGDYSKFQAQHYVNPGPPPAPGPATRALQALVKKPFGAFVGHHHHHHHHQFVADAPAAEPNNGHRHLMAAAAAVGYDSGKAATDPKAIAATGATDNCNKTPRSSSSSSSAADAADFAGPAAGTSCKCGIVDCVLTTSGKFLNNADGGRNDGMSASSTPPAIAADNLPAPPQPQPQPPPPPPPPPTTMSFFMSSSGGGSETGRDDLQSAECSLAVHKHVYHKEYAKNKLFQPYKPDVTTAKLNL